MKCISIIQWDDDEVRFVLDQPNGIGSVMLSMLASSVVDCGFKPWSGQTKDYEIDICCFSAK
jgi:hypothetical protein